MMSDLFLISAFSFRTPPSAFRTQNVRLFEKTTLIKRRRGPPYKARLKMRMFSNKRIQQITKYRGHVQYIFIGKNEQSLTSCLSNLL